MRVQHLAAAVVCAAFFEVAILACQAKSYNDTPAGDDGGDGGDDSGNPGYPLGDDAANGDELFQQFDAFTGGEAGAPCSMPNGNYAQTLTWEPDGGEGDSGGACANLPDVPMTSTFTYPPPFHGANDGSPYGCVYKIDGTLPICDFFFTCLYDDGTTTTRLTGNIDVFNGTYGGTASAEILLDDGGAQYTCEYLLGLTPQ
jgi:hypothetical protein